MTLQETIHKIKDIALKQPNIRTFGEGSIYDILNSTPSVEYGAVVVTQGRHTQDKQFNNFSFSIFYVDRLLSDLEDNRIQIQSIGIEILTNILKVLEEVYDVENQNVSFDVFTQKFQDETAGVYCSVTLITEKELYCGEDY
jgi:hypothetical protein